VLVHVQMVDHRSSVMWHAAVPSLLSTPGQAFHTVLGFVQFYFGLPLAMIII